VKAAQMLGIPPEACLVVEDAMFCGRWDTRL